MRRIIIFLNFFMLQIDLLYSETFWTFSSQKVEFTDNGVYVIKATSSQGQDSFLSVQDFQNIDGWVKSRNALKADYKWNDEKRRAEGFDAPFIVKGGHFFVMLDSTINLENLENDQFFSKIYTTLFRSNIWSIQTRENDGVLFPINEDYLKKIAYNACFKIKSILSSSFYSEISANGTILYDPCSLPYIIMGNDYACAWTRYPPWIPGKEKNANGIGEYLDIEYTEPTDNLVVLNGYVDPYKRYLYKANNRVKKATVTSMDNAKPFKVEYTFEDIVCFAKIELPRKAEKVRFTIDEVYPGEKWNDTCITAVLTDYDIK